MYNKNNRRTKNNFGGEVKSKMIRFDLWNCPARSDHNFRKTSYDEIWGQITDVVLPDLSDMIVLVHPTISKFIKNRLMVKFSKLLKKIYSPLKSLILERLSDHERIEFMDEIFFREIFFNIPGIPNDDLIVINRDQEEILEIGEEKGSIPVLRYDLNYFPRPNGFDLSKPEEEERIEVTSEITSLSISNIPHIMVLIHPRVNRYMLNMLMDKLEKVLKDESSRMTRNQILNGLSETQKTEILREILYLAGYEVEDFTEIIADCLRPELLDEVPF